MEETNKFSVQEHEMAEQVNGDDHQLKDIT